MRALVGFDQKKRGFTLTTIIVRKFEWYLTRELNHFEEHQKESATKTESLRTKPL